MSLFCTCQYSFSLYNDSIYIWTWPYNHFQADVQKQLLIIPDFFHFRHCVDTNLNTPSLETAKTFAFVELITPADDQLIKCH